MFYRNAEQLKSHVKENTAHLSPPVSIENPANVLSWSLHPVKTLMLAITNADRIAIAPETRDAAQTVAEPLALILS